MQVTQSHNDCIASDRVEGTAVYGSDGDKIGSVDCVMIEKRTGQAREAIVDVGSFLGMGGTRHTVPWQKVEPATPSPGRSWSTTKTAVGTSSTLLRSN